MCDSVVTLLGEVRCWSLLGVEELNTLSVGMFGLTGQLTKTISQDIWND